MTGDAGIFYTTTALGLNVKFVLVLLNFLTPALLSPLFGHSPNAAMASSGDLMPTSKETFSICTMKSGTSGALLAGGTSDSEYNTSTLSTFSRGCNIFLEVP